MTFPDSFLEEVRSRLRLADIVGRRVKLVRQGHEWKGLCPFHHEKTPSFNVVEEKGFYHCFGCGAHGDVFRFVMETEGLDFRDTVVRLAEEAGVPMPQPSRGAVAAAAARLALGDLVAEAASWYAAALTGPGGAATRAYLKGRGLEPEDWERFQLGFAPARGLIAHLTAKGATAAEIAEAGLARMPEDGREPYDFFRNRLMIPIRDPKGRPIAFGARALTADVTPKYLNSPDTPLFQKGRVLYHFDAARRPAFERREIIVAEGYLDVIALARAGFPHSVAPLGTALTAEQLELLWRAAPEPILCFDGDAAGRRAAQRALERALPLLKPGQSLAFAFLPPGQDPDDLLRAEGAGAMAAVLKAALPLATVLWAKLTAGVDLGTPERQARLEADVRAAVAVIADPTVRRHYQRDMEARLAAQFGPSPAGRPGAGAALRPRGPVRPERPERLGRAGPIRLGRGPQRPFGPDPALALDPLAGRARAGQARSPRAREGLILLLLVYHPALIARHYEALEGLDFRERDLERLRCALLELAADGGSLDKQKVYDHLAPRGLVETVARLAAQPGGAALRFLHGERTDPEAEACLRDAMTRMQDETRLTSELHRARAAWAEQPTQENLARVRDLETRLSLSATPAEPPPG